MPLAPAGEDERTDGPGFGRHDRGYDATDARLAVDRLLATLPEHDRRIVEMRFMDGMTHTEIADEVGVSQVQVSRLLRAARAHEPAAQTRGRLRARARTAPEPAAAVRATAARDAARCTRCFWRRSALTCFSRAVRLAPRYPGMHRSIGRLATPARG